MKNKIYMSYSRHDYEKYAKPLEEAFKRQGIDYWDNQRDIGIMTNWDDDINQGLNECSVFLVLITENYRKSSYNYYDAHTIFKLYNDDPNNKTLIPIYIGPRLDEKIDNLFIAIQSVVLNKDNMEEEIKKILEIPAIKKCSIR